MKEIALYNKYRPHQLDEIVGQKNVVDTFKQASINDNFAQTYIFSGQKGSGKTSSARIVANLLTCENVKNGILCTKCRACQIVPNGMAMDVIELDAAKNRNVEHMETLIDGARWAPSELKRKVIILDECLGKNSRINTEDGLIPIYDIVNKKRNINVWSYNEKSKKIELKPITGWFKNSGKKIYKIVFETKGVLYASNNHLISTPNGFKKIRDIRIGDEINRINITGNSEKTIIKEKIISKKLYSFEKVTYDLEIKDNHNYFASGTLVHNCHQLSDKAISSLLKITEEPPSYLTFIFCTTDVRKIPDTILSRSQRFNFRKITSKEIGDRLRFIADSEKINITNDALFNIAKISRGCLRDAIVPLEQISTLVVNKEITSDIIQKYFCLPDRQAIFNMTKSMISGNIALLLDQVNDLIVSSVDIESIAYEISEIFRSIMIIKAQGDTKLIDIPDNEINDLKKISDQVKLGQLDKLSRLFSSIKKEITYSINDRWILESTLVHCAALLRKT